MRWRPKKASEDSKNKTERCELRVNKARCRPILYDAVSASSTMPRIIHARLKVSKTFLRGAGKVGLAALLSLCAHHPCTHHFATIGGLKASVGRPSEPTSSPSPFQQQNSGFDGRLASPHAKQTPKISTLEDVQTPDLPHRCPTHREEQPPQSPFDEARTQPLAAGASSPAEPLALTP